jgi:hypothetical protein
LPRVTLSLNHLAVKLVPSDRIADGDREAFGARVRDLSQSSNEMHMEVLCCDSAGEGICGLRFEVGSGCAINLSLDESQTAYAQIDGELTVRLLEGVAPVLQARMRSGPLKFKLTEIIFQNDDKERIVANCEVEGASSHQEIQGRLH